MICLAPAPAATLDQYMQLETITQPISQYVTRLINDRGNLIRAICNSTFTYAINTTLGPNAVLTMSIERIQYLANYVFLTFPNIHNFFQNHPGLSDLIHRFGHAALIRLKDAIVEKISQSITKYLMG